MFGKPNWFRRKRVGWGLRPVSWKGWMYAVVWAAVICVPFIALLAQQLLLESLVWVVVMMVFMLWDVRQVMRDIDAPRGVSEKVDEDVLIIDENTEPDPSYYATRSYDLRLRR